MLTYTDYLPQICLLYLFVSYAVVKVRLHSGRELVGSSGLEPPTLRLSGVRSNQLSYEPMS